MSEEPKVEKLGTVEYEHVDKEYLAQRQLTKKAGWVLLWGLGVGAVISGEYSGWNFGLLAGGFWGLAIATVLIAIMYITMMYCLAELSTALPHAGGPYSFARQAFGPWGGYMTGLAVVIEYVVTPAVIVTFIADYLATIIPAVPLPVWWVLGYVIFVGINIWGVELTLRISLAVTIIAAAVLVIYYVSAIFSGQWSAANLFTVAPDPGQSATWLPKGWYGVFAAIPFAIWFFLAIEELPLAAEETEDVGRDMPKAMLSGIGTLVVLALLVLVLNSGINYSVTLDDGTVLTGAAAIGPDGAPLARGFEVIFGGGTFLAIMLVLVGLTGLIASFHAIIYAYGRQIFALSRAGYFPRFWSLTLPSRHTPHVALIGGGIIGLILAFILKLTQGGVIGFALLTIAVVGGAISYILMMASYIVIKRRMPHLNRPYVSPGGELFAWIAGILAVISLLACFAIPDYRYGAIGVILFFLVGLVYFWLVGRHNLVAEAPEEESALIEAAQKELGQASA